MAAAELLRMELLRVWDDDLRICGEILDQIEDRASDVRLGVEEMGRLHAAAALVGAFLEMRTEEAERLGPDGPRVPVSIWHQPDPRHLQQVGARGD